MAADDGITSSSAQNRQATTSNDYGVNKAVENLPALRKAMPAINDNYLNVQQDIVETFVDRMATEDEVVPKLDLREEQPVLAAACSRSLALKNFKKALEHCKGCIESPALRDWKMPRFAA
jgi:hypothetical protein